MEQRLNRPPSQSVVLIAAGYDDTLPLYAIALSAAGFDVINGRDSAEAFDRALEMRPDVIVTDLEPCETTGWALLELLKGEPRTRDIPIVVLTADAEPTTRERARRAGCNALVVKSCGPEEFAVGLRALLDRHSGRDHALVFTGRRRRG